MDIEHAERETKTGDICQRVRFGHKKNYTKKRAQCEHCALKFRSHKRLEACDDRIALGQFFIAVTIFGAKIHGQMRTTGTADGDDNVTIVNT